MIKAEELRVGNYVNVFDSITGNCYWKCTWNMIGSSDFLEPIPIQPAILEKAGLLVNGKLTWGYLYDHEKMIFYYGNTEVRYLHQLQNLFFALTGEELMINL